MVITNEPPPARPVFRRLAAGVAVVCFVLAVVFRFTDHTDDWWFGVGICLLMGVVMGSIAATGYLPRRRPRR